MKYSGKKERIYQGKKLFPVKKGYSLGTVYRFDLKEPDKYELLNFGYCPSDKTFYFNKNINLPEEIVSKIEKMPISVQTSAFLSEIGLFSYDDVNMLLNQYENANQTVESFKARILNLKQTLKHN